MLLKGEQLPAHLERELRPLYVVYGDEPLLTLEAADAIRARARQAGYSEREVLAVLPGFDWSEFLAAGSNLSLFGDRKLIDLRIPGGKPGKDGSAALQRWCEQLNPDNLLLVTLPELDWKEEKAAWLTALAQAGVAIKLQAPPLAELPGWIAGRLRRQQQSADSEALRFIAERVEGNLLAAHQEIRKLGLLYPTGALSLAQVREAVLNVARYDIDDLRDALLAGDLARYTRTLQGLRHEGEALPLLLWGVCEEIRALAQVRHALDRGQPFDLACKESRIWGPRQAQLRKALQKHDTTSSTALLTLAARIDRLIKGLGLADPWEQLLQLGLQTIQPQKSARS
ncbi:MAG: hypothetical protein RIR00_2202 [Pseudomonadota bacterium]|jgi:DNA polymerase-3 subunit delta